jgi:glutaredoxin 2
MSEQTQYDITIDPAVRKYAEWRQSQPKPMLPRLSVRMYQERLDAWHAIAAEAGYHVNSRDQDRDFSTYVRQVPELIRDLQRQVRELTELLNIEESRG